jgi:lysozyme family protein
MTDFNEAYKILEELEGFYSNNPNDPGGRTWKGIARNYWPRWAGWKLIDQAIHDHPGMWQTYAKEDPDLEGLVKGFYVEQFWNRIRGDKIQNQDIANELFEQAVNMGVHKAVTHLQQALNLLIPHLKKLSVDGIFGPNTMEQLNTYLSLARDDSVHALLGVLNIYQGMHYIALASNPDTGHKYRVFLKGWVNKRVKV